MTTPEDAYYEVCHRHAQHCKDLNIDQDDAKFNELMEESYKWFATEAIKADRQRISQMCLNKATTHEGVSFSCPFDVESINSLPIEL